MLDEFLLSLDIVDPYWYKAELSIKEDYKNE